MENLNDGFNHNQTDLDKTPPAPEKQPQPPEESHSTDVLVQEPERLCYGTSAIADTAGTAVEGGSLLAEGASNLGSGLAEATAAAGEMIGAGAEAAGSMLEGLGGCFEGCASCSLALVIGLFLLGGTVLALGR